MSINNLYLYSNSINYIKKHNLQKELNNSNMKKSNIKSNISNNQSRKEISITFDKIANKFANMKIK